MKSSKLPRNWFSHVPCTALLLMLLSTIFLSAAQAQTLIVLHPFGSLQGDGAHPLAGLTMDGRGNLYGTASSGGHLGGSCGNGCGNVFELKRSGNNFLYNPLYTFQGGSDGNDPESAVTIGPNGTLYGATVLGGGGNNAGTVFNVQPQPSICRAALCAWREKLLLYFNHGNPDNPYGQLVFDQAGNLYGTTLMGGSNNEGQAFQLSPVPGGWTESILYNFGFGPGGYQPVSGVIVDAAGNLYGTTQWGETGGYGAVYKLTQSGQSWTESTLYSFSGGTDGGRPSTGLLMDSSGNVYGTTGWVPETNNPGTVFELSPSGGGWTYKLLNAFPVAAEGAGEVSNLVMDASGGLYGTTSYEGNFGFCSYGCGTIFKLTPSGDGWTYTDLYNFTGGSDGSTPFGGVVLDSAGNLYGTAEFGGTGTGCVNGEGDCGVVWEFRP